MGVGIVEKYDLSKGKAWVKVVSTEAVKAKGGKSKGGKKAAPTKSVHTFAWFTIDSCWQWYFDARHPDGKHPDAPVGEAM